MPEPNERGRNSYFDGLPLTEAQIIIFCIIMLVYFFQQYCNWSFVYLAPAFARGFDLDSSGVFRTVALVGGCFFLGQGLGAVVSGLLSDRYGRRPMLLISLLIFSIAGVVSGLADELWGFILAHSAAGYGIFAVMGITNSYIAEVTPAHSRGKVQGLIAGVGFTGAVSAAFLSWQTVSITPDAWRYVFYFSGMGLLPFFLALTFLKESPRWLLGRGRKEEARAVLRELSGRDVELVLPANAGQVVSLRQKLELLCGGEYRKRFFSLLVLYGLGTPALFSILLWPPILLDAELGLGPAMRISAYVALFVPMGALVSAYMMSAASRRISLLFLLAVAGGGHVGYAWSPPDSPVLVLFGIASTIGVMGASFILFTYTAESFPTDIRNTAVGLLQGFGRLAMALFQIPAFLVADAYGRSGHSTLIGAILLALIPLLLWLTADETAGRGLEDLHIEKRTAPAAGRPNTEPVVVLHEGAEALNAQGR